MRKENIVEIFKGLAVRAQKAGILNLEEVPVILQAIEFMGKLQESQAETPLSQTPMAKEPQLKEQPQTKK